MTAPSPLGTPGSSGSTFLPGVAGMSVGQLATLACLLEVAAPKPGNVHRGADFADLTFTDFAVSAAVIGPALERAREGVGAAVLAAVQATRELTATNTNLGMVLLLAPLAAAPDDMPLAQGVAQVLAGLTAEDAQQIYAAIRWAQPGGLGQTEEMDVAGPAPPDLLAAMRAAAGRDLVARQYAENFPHVLEWVAPWLADACREGHRLTDALVHAHVRLLSLEPDSLIQRKCGPEMALRASRLARTAIEAGGPGDEAFWRAAGDLDFWLRADGQRRNPGTTADIVTAGLFAALRCGWLKPLFR